ncbi:hypothetical protein ACSAZK_01155 [Methanosarcina sp. Mfa9]|uniref:hypothetical protein n=1 Tax=Methanosarcina sp. Mfa9 TaxID=3439063 RepID=UPI003F841AF3
MRYADEKLWDLCGKWYHEEKAELEDFRHSYERIEDTEKRMRIRHWVINDLECELKTS